MTRSCPVALLSIGVVLAACGLNYQQKFAGNIALHVANHSASEVEIFIHKPDGTVLGKRWGEPLKPGQEVDFKIAAGPYKFVAGGKQGTLQPDLYGSTYIDVSGPMTFVVADGAVAVQADEKLVVLGVAEGDAVDPIESAMDSEAAAEEDQCVPDWGECTAKSCCTSDTSHGCYREMVDNGGAWTGRMLCMPNEH